MQAASVEDGLERVLGSRAFSRAGRLRKFLEYVVQEELGGRGCQLKEYAIGVEVFGRGHDYNPRIDTIVRVEAIKLRERLESYFETEGATEPMRIAIPKGCYRPVFELRDEQPIPILDDPESLYWQARLLTGRTPEDCQRALRLLREGVRRWPSNARVHAILAAALSSAVVGFLAPREGIPLMQRAARRALELDASQSDAHLCANLADLLLNDKTAIIATVRRALGLSPQNAVLHHWGAAILVADGRFEEALLHARHAERLEPAALAHKTRTGMVLLYCRKYNAAIGYFRDILACQPDDNAANFWFSRVLSHAGRADEAVTCASRAYAVTGATKALAELGYANACAGNAAEASRIAEQLRAIAKERYVHPSGLAAINVALGRMDAAAADLTAAMRDGDFLLGWAKTDRRWEPLRGKVAGL